MGLVWCREELPFRQNFGKQRSPEIREKKYLSRFTGLLIRPLQVRIKGRVQEESTGSLALVGSLGNPADLGFISPTAVVGATIDGCSFSYGRGSPGLTSRGVYFSEGIDHGSSCCRPESLFPILGFSVSYGSRV